MYAKPIVQKLDLAVERALCCHVTISPRLPRQVSNVIASGEPIVIQTPACPFPVFSDQSVTVLTPVGSVTVSGS